MTSRVRGLKPEGLLLAIIILLIGILLELGGHDVGKSTGGEIMREAGFVLIGTVLVTYCYDAVLRRRREEELFQIVAKSIVKQGPEFGLVSIVERLDFVKLFDELQKGDQLLWLDTYCPDFPNYQESLRDAAGRGARIQLLAVRPTAKTAELRAREIRKDLGYDPRRFADDARTHIALLADMLEDLDDDARDKVELRLYDDLPCAPMYLHLRNGRPKSGFTGYFLRLPTFREPHIGWTLTSGGMLTRFCEYFAAKWDAHESDVVDLSRRRPNGQVSPTEPGVS